MDTGGWLQSLGLERYEQAFRDNEIDVQVLPNLTGEDLKELGVSTVGHRRRLLDAIAALRTGTPSTHEAAVTTLPAGPESEHTGVAPNAERRQLTVMFCDSSAQPRWRLALIRKICERCSEPITPPWPRWSPDSGAMSPSIWVTASSPISAIRRRMSMMPSRRCGPV